MLGTLKTPKKCSWPFFLQGEFIQILMERFAAAAAAAKSLGFSRQEHWSGLPFPSPLCESEK